MYVNVDVERAKAEGREDVAKRKWLADLARSISPSIIAWWAGLLQAESFPGYSRSLNLIEGDVVQHIAAARIA